MTSNVQEGLIRDELGAKTRAFPISVPVEAAALYGLCFVLLATLIFAVPGFLGNDDYYHARMGREIVTQGRLALEFPWLPRTILSPDKFVDHHLLYHLYLAPWVHWGGLTGAKLAQATAAAGVFLAVWALLRQIGVRYPALWSLALFGLSAPFLHRMLMIRTQGVSLLLLVLALIVLFQRRYRWLTVLSFAYAWLYNGFVLMPALAALHVGAEWLAERRLNLSPLVYSVLGVGLGLAVNPYFPRNLLFLVEHLGAKVNIESSVRVGSEWYPYTTGTLLANSGGALLVLILGVLRSSAGGHRRDRIENLLLFAALLTLFLLFRSRRFIEYYPAFALLFCAAAWGKRPVQALQMFPRQFVRIISAAALALGVIFAASTLADARQTIEDADDPRWFVGASNWLGANTPEGTSIFQTDWDDFTRLFYYNTSNTYLVGLDPTYLERADPSLWRTWVSITRGEVEQPSGIIRQQFGSRYVVSDRQHEAFIERAAADPNMRLVYWDKNSMVWQIEE